MLWTIISVLIPLFIFGLYFWGAVRSEINDKEWMQREKECNGDSPEVNQDDRDTLP